MSRQLFHRLIQVKNIARWIVMHITDLTDSPIAECDLRIG